MPSKKKLVPAKPQPKKYILLTGKDDAAFCQRVSDKIDAGYELYGSPSISISLWRVRVSQALVLKKPASKRTK
jgi:hypothetical protein